MTLICIPNNVLPIDVTRF